MSKIAVVSHSGYGHTQRVAEFVVGGAGAQHIIWVGQPEKSSDSTNRIGSYSGVMAQCGAQDPASAIPQIDLDTAHAYGKRIADLAVRFK